MTVLSPLGGRIGVLADLYLRLTGLAMHLETEGRKIDAEHLRASCDLLWYRAMTTSDHHDVERMEALIPGRDVK